jgi:GINS complex subunit 4
MAGSDDGREDGSVPRFSFGEMALADEPGRAFIAGAAARGGGNTDTAVAEGAAGAPNAASVGAAPVLSDSVAKLRSCMINEERAPDILPYAADIVDAARALVSEQTVRVDQDEDAEPSLVTHLQRMEIDRINYMLRCYFRMRIKKIETSVLFIFKDEKAFDNLSKDEQHFAAAYMDLVEDHFKKSFLSMLPERLRVLDKDGKVDHATRPNLDKFVFCHVLNTVGRYALSDDATEQPFDLTIGDILCIRYGGIQRLLESGDVELI